MVGEMGPPCGTPCSVFEYWPLYKTPASNQVRTTLLLIGVLSNIHLCSTESYAFLISMLSINRFC